MLQIGMMHAQPGSPAFSNVFHMPAMITMTSAKQTTKKNHTADVFHFFPSRLESYVYNQHGRPSCSVSTSACEDKHVQ